MTRRCVVFGCRWGEWVNVPDIGLDERRCRRRGCDEYDNRDDGTGFMERVKVAETVARLRASRPIIGELPEGDVVATTDERRR